MCGTASAWPQKPSLTTERTGRCGCADGQNWERLSLERTRAGHWMSITPDQWREQREGPVRLKITSRRGDEEWILLRDVQPAPEGHPFSQVTA
jgi:hypothetical protein